MTPSSPPLSQSARRQLKRLAHHLKPVVQTGAAGLSPAVVEEIRQALAHHELIKVKLVAAERGERDAMARDICQQTGAALVQRIGGIGTFYRENPEAPKVSQQITAAQ